MTPAELKYLTAINELYDGTVGIKLISIAAKMNVTKVSVYRAVERLENHGYIKRDEKNKVVMTEHGYEQLERYKKHFKNPHIVAHDLQHEELLICYPEKWVEEIEKYCFGGD